MNIKLGMALVDILPEGKVKDICYKFMWEELRAQFKKSSK